MTKKRYLTMTKSDSSVEARVANPLDKLGVVRYLTMTKKRYLTMTKSVPHDDKKAIPHDDKKAIPHDDKKSDDMLSNSLRSSHGATI